LPLGPVRRKPATQSRRPWEDAEVKEMLE